jgi:hypothetical protein
MTDAVEKSLRTLPYVDSGDFEGHDRGGGDDGAAERAGQSFLSIRLDELVPNDHPHKRIDRFVMPALADISERLWLSFRPIACVSVSLVTHPNIVANLVALTRVVSALPSNKVIVQVIALGSRRISRDAENSVFDCRYYCLCSNLHRCTGRRFANATRVPDPYSAAGSGLHVDRNLRRR